VAIEVSTPAWKTVLGNAMAKSVLAKMADHVNPGGVGFPSLETIAAATEINIRTVMRIVQVFRVMGLFTRIDRGRKKPAWQIDLTMLERDLSREFAETYAQLQGKPVNQRRLKGAGCRSDSDDGVAATVRSVAATARGVAATVPPHPHIGGTVTEPPWEPSPVVPVCTGTLFYSDALELAVDQVCSALAIANRRRRRLLRDVIALEATKGDLPATIALRLIEAWNRYNAKSHLLTVKYGLAKFVGEGIWKDERRWHFNEELLRHQGAASVGSGR
jgi:hypothetical protein